MGGFMNEKTKIIETKQNVKDQIQSIIKQHEQLELIGRGLLVGVCAEKGLNPAEYGFNQQGNLQLLEKKDPNGKSETPAS